MRARHFKNGEQIENVVLVNQLDSLRAQPDKVGAILAVVPAFAMIDAKQVGIGAVAAFTEGDTDLGDGNPAGAADCEQVLTLSVLPAGLECLIVVDVTEYPATHENMAVCARIHLYLLKGFVNPVDAISAVYCQSFFSPFKWFIHPALLN